MKETSLPVNQPIATENEVETTIRLADLWSMCITRWYWFVLSLLVALSIAVVYLMSTPIIYTRNASVLVKIDDKKNSSVGAGVSAELSNIGILRTNANINNEIITMQSPVIMTEVVKRLGLNDVYRVRQGLRTVNLYRNSPITVTFGHEMKHTVSFVVEPLSNTQFEISQCKIDGKEVQAIYKGNFNTTVHTACGNICLSKTKHFNKESIGQEIHFSHTLPNNLADAYLGKLNIALSSKESTVVDMSIKDESPRKAEDILNTLITVYNEQWVQDRNLVAESTSQFITERLAVIEADLGHVDNNISSYKSQNLLTDVNAASALYMNQAMANQSTLLTLNNQKTMAQFVLNELQQKPIEQTLPSNSGIANVNVENLISEYNSMVLERNRLIANSSQESPVAADMAHSLKNLQQAIHQSLTNLVASLNTQIESYRKQDRETTSQLASNPNQAKYLLSVERQQKVKESLYVYLLQKREENELSKAFVAYNTRIITPPCGSVNPTSPRRSMVLFIALALGLAVPTGIIYLIMTMNNQVRGRKDLEGLNVPIVGEIPLCGDSHRRLFGRRKPNTRTMVVEEGNRNVVNEAFRVLRSNVKFIANSEGKNTQVFIITSFNPGSGKSFITANMAAAFALKGKKVLLIDGDMRHITLSTYFNSPKVGLSNYLNGNIENWQDIVIQSDVYEGLSVIPVGIVPPNPTELLENGNLGKLIAAVRSHYDYVFIDCPPIDIVADTQIIEAQADRTLFVVRAGLLDRTMLPELERIYRSQRFKNVSIVLNGTERLNGRYGYRYGYSYGYSYGRGYN